MIFIRAIYRIDLEESNLYIVSFSSQKMIRERDDIFLVSREALKLGFIKLWLQLLTNKKFFY